MKAVLVGLAVTVVVVVVLRHQLGPPLATVVIAPAVWIAMARCGRIVDRKVFPPPPPVPERRRRVIDVSSRPGRSLDR